MVVPRMMITKACLVLSVIALSQSIVMAQDPITVSNVSTLINHVKSDNQKNRSQALLKLQVMGAEAKAAVPVLAETLSDPNEDIRKLAFDALRSMGVEAKGAMPALIKALDGGTTADRRAAIEVLSKMGDAGKPALASLQRAARDKDFMVSDDAKEVLEQWGETKSASTNDSPAQTEATKPSANKVASAAKPNTSFDKEIDAIQKKLEPAYNAIRTGDGTAAIKIFDAEMQKNPSPTATAAICAGRGMSHVISKQFDKGESDFNKSLASMPVKDFFTLKSPNMEALVNICYNGLFMCHLNLNKWEDAINDQNEMVKYKGSRSKEIITSNAVLYGAIGKFDEGVKEIDKLLKLDPSDQTATDVRKVLKLAADNPAEAPEIQKLLRTKMEEQISHGNANISSLGSKKELEKKENESKK